jgi:NAD+ synthase
MSETPPTDYASLADEIAGWLRFQMDQVGASRLVLGLSGGIDSAVVCALSTMAAGPTRVIAAIMPIYSRQEDVRDAELVASAFEVIPHVIDLVPAHDALINAMPGDAAAGLEDANVDPIRQSMRRQLALANVKPRLRMTSLYYLANRYNGLVAGTGNKTELAIGYFTKYGDGGVDVLPLGDLNKSAVRGLARALGVPEAVISKAPSAGLWEGQTDEAEIGVTYDELDRTLASLAGEESKEPILPDTMDRVSALVAASEHKRRAIPMFRRETVDVISR